MLLRIDSVANMVTSCEWVTCLMTESVQKYQILIFCHFWILLPLEVTVLWAIVIQEFMNHDDDENVQTNSDEYIFKTLASHSCYFLVTEYFPVKM